MPDFPTDAELRIVITGSRDPSFALLAVLTRRLESIAAEHDGTVCLAHGGAHGIDEAAGEWARAAGWKVAVYEADWDGLGRRAGPIRNREMLDDFKPHRVEAFPSGRTEPARGSGTWNCIREARRRRIHVEVHHA